MACVLKSCSAASLLILQGAYQLDATFDDAMTNILADDDVFVRWTDAYRGDYMQFMSSQWENKIKLNFGQSSGTKLQVSILREVERGYGA